jgi:hypothetical protein
MIDLNTLAALPAGWTLSDAMAINLAGQITGTAVTYDPDTELSEYHAYLLTPVTQTPVPAALPLFATGLGALALLARRRRKQTA